MRRRGDDLIEQQIDLPAKEIVARLRETAIRNMGHAGAGEVMVNSLHGQGILEPGRRIVVEGVAEDGTIEAIRIADAGGFALGVQWHAEHMADRNPVNRKLFEAFGAALMKYRQARG